MILFAGPELHPTAHVHAVRAKSPDGLSNVLRSETPGQDDGSRPAHRAHKIPIHSSPGAAGHSGDKGIQQKGADRVISYRLLIYEIPEMDSFNNGMAEVCTVGRALGTVKLRDPQPTFIHRLANNCAIFVDEDPDRSDGFRQTGDDRRGGFPRDRPWALTVKYKAEGVGTRLDRRQGVIQVRRATNLDPDHGERIIAYLDRDSEIDYSDHTHGRFICQRS